MNSPSFLVAQSSKPKTNTSKLVLFRSPPRKLRPDQLILDLIVHANNATLQIITVLGPPNLQLLTTWDLLQSKFDQHIFPAAPKVLKPTWRCKYLLLLLQLTCCKLGCVHICKLVHTFAMQCMTCAYSSPASSSVVVPENRRHVFVLFFCFFFLNKAHLLWSSPLLSPDTRPACDESHGLPLPQMQTKMMMMPAAWKEEGRREGRKGEGEGVRKKNEKKKVGGGQWM